MMKIILLHSMYRHSTNSQSNFGLREQESVWMKDFIECRITEPAKIPEYIEDLNLDELRNEYHTYIEAVCDMQGCSEEDIYFLMKKIEQVSLEENIEYFIRRIHSICQYALWQVMHFHQAHYYYPGSDLRLRTLLQRNRRMTKLYETLSLLAKKRESQKKHYDDCD
jgi:hypothetical protein